MKNKFDFKILIPVFIITSLFLPSLFEPISYGDECIYLTLGNAFNRGLVFYKDIHDNKPPLLYLTAAFAQGHLFWFRLISLTWNLIHLVIIYKLIAKLTKKNWAPIIGGFFFTLGYLIFEGRIANGETFMMMPVTLAVYLLWKYKDQVRLGKHKFNYKISSIIGLLFALGFLFKVPGGFDFIGILIATFLIKPSLSRIKKLFLAAISFTIPIVISIIYYSFKGAFTPYVRSALMQNIGYLSSWQGSNLGLYIRLSLLFLFTLIIVKFRKKLGSKILFFSLWFIFGLFGALLAGRPYPHYFIEIVPSLTILIALTIDKPNFKNIAISASAMGLILISYLYFNFWWYPIAPYYKNFFKYSTGLKTKAEYLNYWGERTKNNYQLAKIIRNLTNLKDRVFIWGGGSCVYALSRRLPPGRYTVNYHIYDFDGYQETAKAIQNKEPKLIIKMANVDKTWPKLNAIIAKNYYRLQIPEINDRVYVRYQR